LMIFRNRSSDILVSWFIGFPKYGIKIHQTARIGWRLRSVSLK